MRKNKKCFLSPDIADLDKIVDYALKNKEELIKNKIASGEIDNLLENILQENYYILLLYIGYCEEEDKSFFLDDELNQRILLKKNSFNEDFINEFKEVFEDIINKQCTFDYSLLNKYNDYLKIKTKKGYEYLYLFEDKKNYLGKYQEYNLKTRKFLYNYIKQFVFKHKSIIIEKLKSERLENLY